ncbi:MAG: homocysteine S-methyltransferase [bacterium]|nr:homocysteine S-methyltransferase [bacterium]
MADEIARILTDAPLVVLDGALATELERRGCDLHDPLWSAKILMEHPELIRAVHHDYFAAGADCATTASYQATFQGFAGRGIAHEQAAAFMRLSVELARQARDAFWERPEHRYGRARPFVAASVGPYGAYLHDGSEYRGNYGLSMADLIDFHRPRMRVLIDSGAELLACETIPSLVEAQAIAELLREFPGVYAWISFSARDGTHTSEGQTLADCAALLDSYAQVAAVGINCTAPHHLPSLIQAAAAHTRKPILVYPNSGETYDAATGTWQGESCSDYAAHAHTWAVAGARGIGGCCRTTPAHIREVAAALRSSPKTAN